MNTRLKFPYFIYLYNYSLFSLSFKLNHKACDMTSRGAGAGARAAYYKLLIQF